MAFHPRYFAHAAVVVTLVAIAVVGFIHEIQL